MPFETVLARLLRNRTKSATARVTRFSGRLPALAVGTVTADGTETRLGGQEPPDADTLFQIGSVTKVFTALVLARQVVRGDLELDQPVADLLPASVSWPHGGAITLGELATHSSGLPRIPWSLWPRAFTHRDDPYAEVDGDMLLGALGGVRLRHRGRHRYSNLGFGLLGLALATYQDTTYADLVSREVCEPLGLADTVVERDPEQRTRSALGHSRRGRPYPVAWEFDAFAGAGAMWSTIGDLQTFLRAQIDPPDDELGAAIRMTRAPHLNARGGPHGLAWFRLPGATRSPAWFHNGGTAGFRSILVVSPEDRRGVVALTNSDRSVDGLGMSLFLSSDKVD